ncbi:hypothetical protein ACWEU6_22015 [Streptosporangium sandarakinum]
MFQLQATPTQAPCQPWCTHHGGDGLCRTRSTAVAYGETVLTYSPDEGHLVWLMNTRDEMTPAQAEQLACALLAQVAAARMAVAA